MRIQVMATLSVAGVLCGCATLVKGTTQSVSLTTPGVAAASCTLVSEGIGTRTVTTPATMSLDKSQHNIAVTCKKECYQDGVGIIASSTETMAAGNIIAGGPIGLGIDAVSGAMNHYNSDNQIAMVPIQGCRPST